jgi:diaminopimelate decarboxylase
MSGRSSQARKNHSYTDPVAYTPHFSWKASPAKSQYAKEVFCEKVGLSEVAAKFGTPSYLYSRAALEDSFREMTRGFSQLPHTLCFAVKCNANLSLLYHLAGMGSGFDIVSGGELHHLGRIGVSGERIVFSGIGKTREEIRDALNYRSKRKGQRGILLFNIESEPELEVLLQESAKHRSRGGVAPAVSVRVNPDVQAGGHPHISTGHHQHKFGLGWSDARRMYLAHRASKYIHWRGISAHIGSQIVSLEPFRCALLRLAGFVQELRREGIALKYLDFGGGLGVRYTNERPASVAAYARMVSKIVRPLGVHLLLEPGRSLIASSGVLLTQVIYSKHSSGKTFIVVDAGMNDLMRPALYDAVHPITRVTQPRGEQRNAKQRVDIVGPVCESGDCFLRDWPLEKVAPGDLLAIWTAGAYGMALSSNYNARCRAAEILVAGARYRTIRRRETPAGLLRSDVLAR